MIKIPITKTIRTITALEAIPITKTIRTITAVGADNNTDYKNHKNLHCCRSWELLREVMAKLCEWKAMDRRTLTTSCIKSKKHSAILKLIFKVSMLLFSRMLRNSTTWTKKKSFRHCIRWKKASNGTQWRKGQTCLEGHSPSKMV